MLPKPEASQEHGNVRNPPREKVEPFSRGCRENFFAVLGHVASDDLILGLTGGERFRDVLARGNRERALKMIAGVNGETAPALACEALLRLALASLCHTRGQEKTYGQKKRETPPQATSSEPRTLAVSRTRDADLLPPGNTQIPVPRISTKPPIQSHATSGFT